MHVITEEREKVKYKMQKNWIMAPIPFVIVDIPNPKRMLPSLKKHSTSMLIEIRRSCNEAVEQFLSFSPVDILRARCFINEALAYKNMQRMDPESIQDKIPLCESEETNPTYRLLAAQLTIEWVPIHEHGKQRAQTMQEEDNVHGARGGIHLRGRNLQGKERTRAFRGSSLHT